MDKWKRHRTHSKTYTVVEGYATEWCESDSKFDLRVLAWLLDGGDPHFKVNHAKKWVVLDESYHGKTAPFAVARAYVNVDKIVDLLVCATAEMEHTAAELEDLFCIAIGEEVCE